MGKSYAVDLWLNDNPGGGCRKTVRGSDWHYVDLQGVEISALLNAIKEWEARDEKDASDSQSTDKPGGSLGN